MSLSFILTILPGSANVELHYAKLRHASELEDVRALSNLISHVSHPDTELSEV
ncbi:MAG: hypothetical protein ACYSWS_05465 [Planctomycetota bacterium]